jgi:hypothetical protein
VDVQLQAVIDDLESARVRLHALWSSVSRDAWHARPGVARWAAGECVAHLNLASEALLPLLRAAVAAAGTRGPDRAPAYRRDPLGWLIGKVIAPSSPLKMRSASAFVPSADQSPEMALAEFDRLQDALVACVRAAEGLAIDRVAVVSPFHDCLHYNLYSAFTLVARHQHRHLVQAKRAAVECVPLTSALAV